jgi:5-formyltetrahydrofolate cyclo-ligase
VPQNQAFSTRAALRHLLLAQRQCLSVAQRASASQSLSAQLTQWLLNNTTATQNVALYSPFRAEPDLLSYATQLTRPLALPVVTAKDQPLTFVHWQPGETLVAGAYGILVPRQLRAVDVDVVVMPCVGFTRSGLRLGYGGGFYDRTVAQLRSQRTVHAIGVAYVSACCELAAHAHDEVMDECFVA